MDAWVGMFAVNLLIPAFMAICLCCIPVESALKKNFDEGGRRK